MPGNIVNLSLSDIAKWPAGNYVNPPHRKWMPGYASFLYVLATFAVLLRVASRMHKARHTAAKAIPLLGFDDALLLVGWALLTWFTVLTLIGSEKYMGSRHMWDIVPSMYTPLTKITWLAEFAFLLCGACVKCSVLLFYRRLGVGTYPKTWSWACLGAIGFTLAWTLAFLLALIFNCSPTEAYWMGMSPSYTKKFHCVDTTVNNLLAGIMAAVSDLYSVALPCFLMRNLQLPRGQMVGLYTVFSAGLLVVVASSVRTFYLYKVGHSSDVSTILYNLLAWTQLELCLGFICASAPSLRMLAINHFLTPYNSCKKHLRTLTQPVHRSMRGSNKPRPLELSIRKLDCPYEQVRNDFTHAKRRDTSETNFTNVTTLVGSRQANKDCDPIELPKKARLKVETCEWPPPVTVAPAAKNAKKPKFVRALRDLMRESLQSTEPNQVSMHSVSSHATHASQDINLQNNIIVDGSNRNWLEEGFEGDGPTMFKTYV